MQIVTVSERGQLVIPHEIRRKLELTRGSKLFVDFSETEGTITLRPVGSLPSLRGFLKGTPPVDRMLRAARREERDRDARRSRR
jgi:AbrB family looped-hinge helix DNA binding protein